MKNKSDKRDKSSVIEKLKSFIPILFMVVLGVVYFYPEFESKRIMGSDRAQSVANNQARFDYPEKEGIDKFVIWNPGIFSGTSALYSGVSVYNPYHFVSNALLTVFRSKGALIFIISLILSYLLARKMGYSCMLSFLMAFSITFTLTNVILYKEGHESKIYTLAFVPLIMWGLYTLFEKRALLQGAVLLVLGIGFSVYTRHPQMSYYLFLILLPFLAIQLFFLIKSKDYSFLAKVVLVGIISALIGLGGNTDRLWNMKTHLDISMRGKKILTVNKDNTEGDTSKKRSSGLEWDYAMGWSNTFPDMMTAVIPGFTGGSYSEKISKEHPLYKKYKIEAAPLYWKESFSIAPTYLGVISIFFLFLTLIFNRNKWTVGLSLGVLLSVLLSFGSNMAWFQKIFFEFVPLYNRFRAPQSILSVAVFILPIASFAFLYKLRDDEFKQSLGKNLFYAIGGFLVFLLFATFVMPSFYSFSSQIDPNLASQGADVNDFIEARKAFLQSDGKRAIILILLVATLVILYVKDKVKYNMMILGITLITMFDLLSINHRYYDWSLFKNEAQINALYNPRAVDNQILQVEKNREDYRVLDLSVNTFNSGSSSYYHNTIGGYSPLKHRRYQDAIEGYISKLDMNVLNMLNTKYVIKQDGNLLPNPQALGIGWFVNDVKYVTDANEEYAALAETNIAESAIVIESEFKEVLNNVSLNGYSTNNRVEFSSYHPDKITYKVKSDGSNLLVLSEMFTDNGMWKATIDGAESEIIRANYLLRAIVVPDGEHEVVFECRPESFYSGRMITLGFGIITLILLALSIYKTINSPNLDLPSKA